MSGHSKWSTIKRKKGANDQARGKMFSKLSKAISLAAKDGGDNPDMNHKLRMAIDAAKAANMPKDTIDRAVKKASETGDLTEVLYEGFGPNGIQFLIEAATDNKNRTSAEIKSILQKSGGNMGGPGSASFNFNSKGYILVKIEGDMDEFMLELIDIGVEDMQKAEEGLEITTEPTELFEIINKLKEKGVKIIDSALIQKPITQQKIEDAKLQQKISDLMESLDEHDDVQNVYTNADY